MAFGGVAWDDGWFLAFAWLHQRSKGVELIAAFCLFGIVARDALLLDDRSDVLPEADGPWIGGVQPDGWGDKEDERQSNEPAGGDQLSCAYAGIRGNSDLTGHCPTLTISRMKTFIAGLLAL